MTNEVETLKRVYQCFNDRDIDGVLAALDMDVAWANGMKGGHVYGHEAIRDYWTSQWSIVDPHVEPVRYEQRSDGAVAVEVRQVVRGLDGKPLAGQTHGLRDKTVWHLFRFARGKVARFDILDTA